MASKRKLQDSDRPESTSAAPRSQAAQLLAKQAQIDTLSRALSEAWNSIGDEQHALKQRDAQLQALTQENGDLRSRVQLLERPSQVGELQTSKAVQAQVAELQGRVMQLEAILAKAVERQIYDAECMAHLKTLNKLMSARTAAASVEQPRALQGACRNQVVQHGKGAVKEEDVAATQMAVPTPEASLTDAFINLVVRDQSKKEVHFKMKKSTPLARMFAAYCFIKAVSKDSCTFLFGGSNISRPPQTRTCALDWDMEDNNVIDAVVITGMRGD